jgi:hypothetical protein
VEVSLDEWGRPTEIVEDPEQSAGGRAGGPADDSGGPPDRLGGEDGRQGTAGVKALGGGGTAEALRRRVEAIVEEWRIDDEWWRTPIHRRYVEVVLEGGAHVVLFEDLVSCEWFMQRP